MGYSFLFLFREILGKRKSGAELRQLKYFSQWKESVKKYYTSLEEGQPWLTYDAIEFLKKNVTKKSVIFEFGGGGSSTFLSRMAGKLFTVEHNPDWFSKLKKYKEDNKINNWELFLCGAEELPSNNSTDFSDPHAYTSSEGDTTKKYYKKYATSIEQYADNFFDCILIDGRARPSCLLHSVNKVRLGGFIIMDNTEREYYLEHADEILRNCFEIVLHNYCPTPFVKELTRTTIWKRIK